MALATADAAGRPSVRMVLLKGHGPDGFVFYTNLDSRKGEDLALNPHAALLFHWKSLRRQVRIEGPVAPVDRCGGRLLFRQPQPRFAAWRMGIRPVAAAGGARDLRSAATTTCAELRGRDVPRPPRWSGFRVAPQVMEFWTDREHRLHERRLFTWQGAWSEGLLYP